MTPIRLIVVDDSEHEAGLIADTLRYSGIDVTYRRVETGEAFTAELAAHPPHLVVCEHQLRAFSAEKALELLSDADHNIPLILVSGEIGEEAAAAMMRAGAREYIPKRALYRLAPVVQRELQEAEGRRRGRLAEAALLHSEAHFRLLVHHSPDIIFRCNLEPRVEITYLSAATAQITGHLPETLIGQPSHLLDLVDPGDRVALEASWHAPTAQPLVTCWHRREGTLAWLEQRLFGIYEGSRLTAVEGVLRDVTDRIVAERERDQLVEQLQQAERLDALGQLANGIAHDFNNLLAIVLGSAAFLADDLGPDSASQNDITKITTAAQRGAALTRQLLIFARQQRSRPEVLDVNAVVVGLTDLLRRTLGERIDLVFVLGPDVERVRIDRERLEQVVFNLALNGHAAMPTGGRITIQTEPLTVPAGGDAKRLPGSYTRLTITDTGCGMAPDVAERAFDPLFTNEPGRAPGLGLTVTRDVVKEAGGHVSLRTGPDKGTAVIIDLPAAQAMSVDAVRTTANFDGKGETILVVEDEDAVRDVVARLLARHNYHVQTATTGAEALQICLHGDITIDALLTDMVMPGMTGPQLAEQLRQGGRELPVLYMSGYAPDYLPIETPVDSPFVIHKPFDALTLLHQLREAIEPGPNA